MLSPLELSFTSLLIMLPLFIIIISHHCSKNRKNNEKARKHLNKTCKQSRKTLILDARTPWQSGSLHALTYRPGYHVDTHTHKHTHTSHPRLYTDTTTWLLVFLSCTCKDTWSKDDNDLVLIVFPSSLFCNLLDFFFVNIIFHRLLPQSFI